jgi:hypothetical protein
VAVGLARADRFPNLDGDGEVGMMANDGGLSVGGLSSRGGSESAREELKMGMSSPLHPHTC